VRGRHYPGSLAELLAWFPVDAACSDYLEWLRWPTGFVCPMCATARGWRTREGRWSCAGCARRVSVTAGTIFDGTRTPLTVWFQAAWQMTSQKNGISALGLQRVLGLGSYQTAWAMLHRYRRAMIRPGRDRLGGRVEVDETLVGGLTPGRKGRAIGAKDLVAVAVEQHGKGLGRCRLQLIADAGSVTLGRFLIDNVVEGSTVITDGWQGYRSATKGYRHDRRVVTGGDPAALLPGVHRVASLLKRWLLGTHQGGIASTHLQDYLDEFTFRFNRRTSRARGLLFFRLLDQAVNHDPVRYRDLVVNPDIGNPRANHPTGPRAKPGTLALPPADRPWRADIR
jgi:transposase-like protein